MYCEWCGRALDSNVHRLFECDAFQHIRDKHLGVLYALEPFKDDFALLPVVTVHPHHEFHDMLLHSIPPATLPASTVQRIADIQPDGPITCYSDGSCAHQNSARTRFAAYGIIIDFATTDMERRHHMQIILGNNRTPPVFQRLVCGRLQGVQSIHRAELAAILWILETFRARDIVVHTDSAWVMDVWQKCLLPNASMLFMDHSDRDLIVRLIHADVSRLHLHKVKAHQDPAQERDPFTRYHLLGNAEADNKLAQWACWNLMPQLVHQLSQLHDDSAKDITLVSDFYKCCLEVQYTRAALQNTQHVGIADNEGAVPSVDVFQKLTDWSVPHSCWVFPQFEESRLQCAVCGKHVIMSLVDWLQSCSWPSDADSDAAHKNLGISWTEIAVAVAVRHNMWLPIKRKQQDNLAHVIQPQTLAECNLLNVTLAEQTANISLMVKNLGSMLMQVFFLLMLLKARSLHYLCMALKQLRA